MRATTRNWRRRRSAERVTEVLKTWGVRSITTGGNSLGSTGGCLILVSATSTRKTWGVRPMTTGASRCDFAVPLDDRASLTSTGEATNVTTVATTVGGERRDSKRGGRIRASLTSGPANVCVTGVNTGGDRLLCAARATRDLFVTRGLTTPGPWNAIPAPTTAGGDRCESGRRALRTVFGESGSASRTPGPWNAMPGPIMVGGGRSREWPPEEFVSVRRNWAT